MNTIVIEIAAIVVLLAWVFRGELKELWDRHVKPQ